jgi:hypothetical protein
MKGMNARRQFQWNETDNFLDNIIYLARNNMPPEKVVAKLADEINFRLQGKNESLPAPQVIGHDPPGYTQLQDAGPAPMQNVYFQYIAPAFLHAPQTWGQAHGNYSPQPNHSVHGNQPAMQTPIGTPQPITPDLRQGIPRLPTDTQLPTAAPQALDNLAPDWTEQSGNVSILAERILTIVRLGKRYLSSSRLQYSLRYSEQYRYSTGFRFSNGGKPGVTTKLTIRIGITAQVRSKKIDDVLHTHRYSSRYLFPLIFLSRQRLANFHFQKHTKTHIFFPDIRRGARIV